MVRHYGSKKRTQKDKRTAALQFVVMSSRPASEKVDALIASYGFSEAEAVQFVQEHSQ